MVTVTDSDSESDSDSETAETKSAKNESQNSQRAQPSSSTVLQDVSNDDEFAHLKTNTENIANPSSQSPVLTPTSPPIPTHAASKLTPTLGTPSNPSMLDYLKGVSQSSPIEVDDSDDGDDDPGAKADTSEANTPLPSLPPTPVQSNLVLNTTTPSKPIAITPLPSMFCEVGTSVPLEVKPECVPDFLKGISESVPIDLDADDKKSDIDIFMETESEGDHDNSASSDIICID